jgi:hypothetical protein
LCLGLHGDDPGGSGYFEFEVSVAGNGHELDITWPTQDDVVRPREVDYLKCECLGAVVARFSEGDRQGDLPKGDMLLTRDHFVEWVWPALELVPSEPQCLKSVEVHEVEAAAPIHESLSEPGCPNQRVDNEGKPPSLRDAVRVVHLVKSDRGFRPMQVFQEHHAHGIDCPVGKFELTAQLVGWPVHRRLT